MDDLLYQAGVGFVNFLKEKKLTVACAESCTGGLFGETVTAVSGASEVFRGGVITYQNDVKIHVLGVKAESVEKYTEVSAVVAREMAERARKIFSSDVAVSFTGYAGPNGGTGENPVGTVYIGVATPKETVSVRTFHKGNRDEVRRTAVLKAFEKIKEMTDAR